MCFVNYSYYNLIHKFCIVFSVILIKLNCLQRNGNCVGGTDANSLRFHDFEPRNFQFHYSNRFFKPKATKYDKIGDVKNKTEDHHHYLDVENINLEREDRAFHFQTTDTDLTIGMEFIIPFVRVPIERGMRLTKSMLRNLLNLKSGSLLWAGAFVVIGALVVGAWNTISALKTAFFPYHRSLRTDRSGSLTDDFDIFINEKLMEHNIDLNACLQRSICQYIEKAADAVRSGQASRTQKILDGLVNANIWPQDFSDTAAYIAIEAGRKSDCHKWKQRCKFTKF